MKQDKSFTLIELLVVIAIIGLITSVSLVAIDLPGQRQKARFAKSLEFSSSIQSAWGAEAVGVWSFDDCGSDGSTPVTLQDTSGYKNNGTNNGAICRTDTPQKVVGPSPGKYALSFDGVYDNVVTGNMNISGAVTVSFWAKEAVWDSQNSAVEKYTWTSGFNGFALRSVSGKWRFYLANNSSSLILDAPSTASAGVWHFIVGTSVSGSHNLYIDGIVVSKDASAFSVTNDPAEPVNIGQRPHGVVGYFNGLIDEVRIYAQALTIGQIQQHYTEGLEKHQDLAVK